MLQNDSRVVHVSRVLTGVWLPVKQRNGYLMRFSVVFHSTRHQSLVAPRDIIVKNCTLLQKPSWNLTCKEA